MILNTTLMMQLTTIFDEHRTQGAAISRAELSRLTTTTDRLVRNAIAELQGQGLPIVALGKGYWLGSEEEKVAYARREKCRALTILRKIRGFLPVQSVITQLEMF